MAISAEQLTEHLISNGLLTAEQVQAVCESTGVSLDSVATETLAKRLVKTGQLTLFQAQMAVSGKAKNLTIPSVITSIRSKITR